MSSEFFQITRTLLEKASGPGFAVMVTSTYPCEGKSLMARYLAWTAQVQFEQRVLLSQGKPCYEEPQSSFERMVSMQSSTRLPVLTSEQIDYAFESVSSMELVQLDTDSLAFSEREINPNEPYDPFASQMLLSTEGGPEQVVMGTSLLEEDEDIVTAPLVVPTMNPSISHLKLDDVDENPYLFLSRELPRLKKEFSLLIVEVSAFQESRPSMPPSLLCSLFDHTVIVFQPHSTSIEAAKQTIRGLPLVDGENCSLLVNHGGLGALLGAGFDWGQGTRKGWTERAFDFLLEKGRRWWSKRQGANLDGQREGAPHEHVQPYSYER